MRPYSVEIRRQNIQRQLSSPVSIGAIILLLLYTLTGGYRCQTRQRIEPVTNGNSQTFAYFTIPIPMSGPAVVTGRIVLVSAAAAGCR